MSTQPMPADCAAADDDRPAVPRREIRIRPATPEDAAAVARLADQLGYPTAPDDMRARLNARMSQPGETVLVAEFLGESDARPGPGEVVGFVHLFDTPPLVGNPRTVEIGGLVVETSRRSAGIGAGLLRAAEDWAARHGGEIVRVRSNVVRADAHRFYERHGYATVKRQVVFERRIEPVQS